MPKIVALCRKGDVAGVRAAIEAGSAVDEETEVRDGAHLSDLYTAWCTARFVSHYSVFDGCLSSKAPPP